MKKEIYESTKLYIVWAKVKGYPWWPAYIINNPDELHPHQKYRVDFFGETLHSFITGSMIQHFRDKYNEYSTGKNKKLVQAIKQAEELEASMLENQQQGNEQQKQNIPTKEVEKKQQILMQLEQQQYKCPQQLHPQTSLLSICQSKRFSQQNESFQAVLTTKRQRPQRKRSQVSDQVYSPYRVNKHKTIKKLQKNLLPSNGFAIPYRRYFDPKYEVRIIDILNKIHMGKMNENDIFKLIKRINNLDKKHLFNKYIISGLNKMLKMLYQRNDQSPTIISLIKQLKAKLQQLKKEISMSLESTADIQEQFSEQIEEESDSPVQLLEELSIENNRKSFIQNIYKILKTNTPIKEGEVGRKESLKILNIVQRLLQNKRVGQVKELLTDLMQKDIDVQQLQRDLDNFQQNQNNRN